MGIVGAGFVGPHHIDAVRRLGYVDVVAGSSQASADRKAEAPGVRQLREAQAILESAAQGSAWTKVNY